MKEAFGKLKDKFESCFSKKLRVFQGKKNEDGEIKCTYLFPFDNDYESTFSFCLLDYANIESRFVGQSKMIDTIELN